jgi:hypothetical protein
MLLAAVGANCSVLNLSFQAVSPFAISFICSRYLTELKLDGVVGVTSADVQRVGDNCPMLRVSNSKHFCPFAAPTSTACLVCLTHAAHVLSLEHCNAIDDAAFAFDLAINLQDVNVSYCVQLTDVGILRLLSCSPRLQTLNMSASATSFPLISNVQLHRSYARNRASLPLISNASLLCLPCRCPCISFLNIAFW